MESFVRRRLLRVAGKQLRTRAASPGSANATSTSRSPRPTPPGIETALPALDFRHARGSSCPPLRGRSCSQRPLVVSLNVSLDAADTGELRTRPAVHRRARTSPNIAGGLRFESLWIVAHPPIRCQRTARPHASAPLRTQRDPTGPSGAQRSRPKRRTYALDPGRGRTSRQERAGRRRPPRRDRRPRSAGSSWELSRAGEDPCSHEESRCSRTTSHFPGKSTGFNHLRRPFRAARARGPLSRESLTTAGAPSQGDSRLRRGGSSPRRAITAWMSSHALRFS